MTLYKNYLNDFKEMYMAYIPLSIILQSCLGSVAAMFILSNGSTDAFPFIQLGLCVIVSMLYNAAVLAQLQYKVVFNMLIVSLITNSILFGLSFISSF